MQNSEQLFSIALGLEQPWFIKEITFDPENSVLDIYLGFTKGHKFSMPDGDFYTAHDTVPRKWQHLNFFSINATCMRMFPE